MLRGTCLCRAVRFETDHELHSPAICHCGQCRKQSGHLWASASVPKPSLTISGPVRWYDSSAHAQRGFCPTCGSFLFWQAHVEDMISFALGAVDDAPADLQLERHIFTADKGDYYDIADHLPQKA